MIRTVTMDIYVICMYVWTGCEVYGTYQALSTPFRCTASDGPCRPVTFTAIVELVVMAERRARSLWRWGDGVSTSKKIHNCGPHRTYPGVRSTGS
ncbi:hypothetical protein EX30DRAFT_185176 [Ascodesmis nigricans]|uniref:Uncharacterized protein n=1 Tax=Ascodesmis nigricans TaxID=341454 RepID=A0A4S2N017_9PEZI|nr:hypothetical protein EX30DRAFT_185176 [Ascodesmis nigricans]